MSKTELYDTRGNPIEEGFYINLHPHNISLNEIFYVYKDEGEWVAEQPHGIKSTFVQKGSTRLIPFVPESMINALENDARFIKKKLEQLSEESKVDSS